MPGKDGEAGDVGYIVDAAGRNQAKKGPLEARSSFLTQPSARFSGDIVHLAYVEDDQKLLCWIPQNEVAPGATYARLPNVVGKCDPAKALRERTPVAGTVPLQGHGRKLYENMKALIRTNGDELVPVWSGDVSKRSHPVSWMGLGKDPQ